ncbi:hypothetical protein llap_1190 [Limosa lapponica baueri]|uniref:Uncharacterized protein n=1 Tax=Limosa lapponica baueri TaxID=1758121 RepID=A0A2I0UQX9_LIMLA|nr:hypothetical protein llap_1190 [Limosa lapponica baueri]
MSDEKKIAREKDIVYSALQPAGARTVQMEGPNLVISSKNMERMRLKKARKLEVRNDFSKIMREQKQHKQPTRAANKRQCSEPQHNHLMTSKENSQRAYLNLSETVIRAEKNTSFVVLYVKPRINSDNEISGHEISGHEISGHDGQDEISGQTYWSLAIKELANL